MLTMFGIRRRAAD